MMIVDLVDEVDFKERLIAIGAPVTQDDSLDAVKEAVLSWLKDYPEQVSFVKAICEQLNHDEVTVLPEVQEVIQSLL